MKKNNLVVSECFYSIQGEGQTTGIPAVFLRLAGCNLLCKSKEWICDSIEVWQKGVKTDFNDVIKQDWVSKLKEGAHLVLTGGEPMLHQKKITEYLKWFAHEYDFMPVLEVETNSTIMPSDELFGMINYWNCSPKLASSGETYGRRVNLPVIHRLNQHEGSIFKFVIAKSEDVLDMFQEYGDTIKKEKVVLMPAGETQEKLMITRPMVAEQCKNLGLRYCDRLHIILWNLKTGV